jgi:hypothetical protein
MLSVVDMFNKVHIFVSNNHVHGVFISIVQNNNTPHIPGADPGGNMIFWRKIVIFHTKYLKYFRASLRNWKKYDFLA